MGGCWRYLGLTKMMYTLPTVWPQGVWGTSRHGPWLTYKGQVSQQRRDGVEVREAHHERRTLPGWTKTGEAERLTRKRAAYTHEIPDTTCERRPPSHHEIRACESATTSGRPGGSSASVVFSPCVYSLPGSLSIPQTPC
jgi:hypothetical protein